MFFEEIVEWIYSLRPLLQVRPLFNAKYALIGAGQLFYRGGEEHCKDLRTKQELTPYALCSVSRALPNISMVSSICPRSSRVHTFFRNLSESALFLELAYLIHVQRLTMAARILLACGSEASHLIRYSVRPTQIPTRLAFKTLGARVIKVSVCILGLCVGLSWSSLDCMSTFLFLLLVTPLLTFYSYDSSE